MAKSKHYVIQDCVECDDRGEYSFKCDGQVSHTWEAAKAAAWTRFAGHYSRITGKTPPKSLVADFEEAMEHPKDGVPSFCVKTGKTFDVTVEILEREAV